ncbi:MAG: NTF2-like N-terminal transpeptidase domain-containing protein [Nitriliruptorales bacterium]|nr:NTF2-like N-terminal transpeptidase domain-containing protein [Nitriliruptorales bacterium]
MGRLRDWRAGVAVALVVAGAAGLALWLLFSRTERDFAAEAAAVFDAYTTAWEQWDTQTMASLVSGDRDQLVAMHEQWRDTLGEATVSVTAGTVLRQGAQADLGITVTVDPDWASAFTWDSHLRAVLEDGDWQIAWTPSVLHPELRDGYRLDVVITEGGRAPILGTDDVQLSGSGERHVIGIEPRRLRQPERLRDAVARALPEALEDLEELLADDSLVPHWFHPFVTLRPERFEDAWDSLRPIDGVLVRTEDGRLPIEDGFARHVLGRVGELTAEDLEELGPPYSPGDHGGLYGLERVFEEQLVGGEGVSIVIREPDDDIHVILHEFAGDPATPVTTTLDAALQQAVENALVGVPNAAVVAIDIESGAIRASASRPLDGYNRAWEGRYRLGAIADLLDDNATALADDDWVATLSLPAVAGAIAEDHRFTEASVLQVATLVAAAHSGTWRAPSILADEETADPVMVPGGDRRQVLVDATPEALPAGTNVARLVALSTSAPAASGADHAWFVGVRDGIAIAVLVENGGVGRTRAAPIAVRVFSEYDALTG